MDWRAMLKDKKLLYGVGLAAAAGAAVLFMRSRNGGTGSASTGTVTGPSYQGAGTIDTTGTDVASWLGSYSASLQAQLDEQNKLVQEQLSGYEKSLKDALDGLGAISDEPGESYVTVTGGTQLTDLANRYGLSVEKLQELNSFTWPKIGESNKYGWISDTNKKVEGDPTNALSFLSDQQVRVK